MIIVSLTQDSQYENLIAEKKVLITVIINGRGYQNWLTLHNLFLMAQQDLMLTKEVSKVIHSSTANIFTKSVLKSIL